MNLFKWFALALMIVISTLGIFATAYAQSGGDASRGAVLFAQNCAVCHGDKGQGRVGATLAKDFPGIRVDVLLKDIISGGVPGSVMPAWSKTKGGPLTDAEIDDLIAFVRSLGNQAPTVILTPVATPIVVLPSPVATFPAGDPTRGAQIFAANCAVCHGPNGEGRIGATLEKDWAGINVNALIETTVSRGVAGSKMPAWAQSYGGPLTNQDIADVASFVPTLKKSGQPAPTQSPSLPSGGDFGGVVALVCVGVVVVVGLIVLVIGLAGSRKKK